MRLAEESTRFKDFSWSVFHAVRPVASLLSFTAFAVVMAVQFHSVNVAQSEAKASADEAASLAIIVANNQVTAHDSILKGCIQSRDAQVVQADNDDSAADIDHQLGVALKASYPKIATILFAGEGTERSTATVIRGDITANCQYAFRYPPPIVKALQKK